MGRLVGWELFGEAVGTGVAIPRAGQWQVRVYRRGSAELIDAMAKAFADDATDPPSGIEQYLIQIWPVAPATVP